MKARCCPTCKRPLAETGIAASLPRIKRRIYEAVAASGEQGINRWEIMDRVYANEGDPCPETIKVHVVQINRRIKEHGVKITANHREGPHGGNGLYRLITLEEAHA